MTRTVVAVVGLSGVGKSTLLQKLNEGQIFRHFQASVLIREQKAAMNEMSAQDILRLGNIEDNQRLLVEGFKRATDNMTGLIVLDGHTIIDTPAGIVVIHPDVFRDMGVSRFVFVYEDPAVIALRRAGDSSRKRPLRTEDELREQQEMALICAFRASIALGAGMRVTRATDFVDSSKAVIE
ncbi:ATP-binding protein [Siccirubricoccus phaeus]|uniref:ATP-binding protein n=1 Tax=Siccirubricoccus phaeus TaxID=2595053 RepID=UPI0011F36A0D|nr:AAA family ATPase [Siccirubricoccus phaeus]